MHEVLGPDHLLLVRKHPFVRAPLRLQKGVGDFVVDVSDYREINELMLVADVLATDCSSSRVGDRLVMPALERAG